MICAWATFDAPQYQQRGAIRLRLNAMVMRTSQTAMTPAKKMSTKLILAMA
jgi:hypothetical protein